MVRLKRRQFDGAGVENLQTGFVGPDGYLFLVAEDTAFKHRLHISADPA